MALAKKTRGEFKPAAVELQLKLFDDIATRAKLQHTPALTVMFDDVRNKIPDSYVAMCQSLSPGDTLRIVVEKLPPK